MSLEEAPKGTVLVAMSGGVDSSMAAVLLHEQGYQVEGAMMRLWAEEQGADNRCCSAEAAEGARQVCEILGVPFRAFDFEAEFKRRVVDPFVVEYGRGRTPNPCLACNRHLKFGLLLRHALEGGAQYLATGHYARVLPVNGQHRLLKGVDASKDQSYVLYMLGQEELAHLLWPLGEYTKMEVRAMAQERGLPVADREESQEICFVTGDYRDFLRRRADLDFQPGPIVNLGGEQVGRHKGLPAYTIGQREGLGIAAPHPLYVLKIDSDRNTIVVGPRRYLLRRELIASHLHFVTETPPEAPLKITAKVRYRAREAAATLTLEGRDEARVRFLEPQPAIAPGQGVVFYDGEQVIGGGIIEEVI